MKNFPARRSVSVFLVLITILISLSFSALSVEPVLGDANGDGVFDTSDARVVLRFCVGLEDGDSVNLTLADVDGIFGITTDDARVLLRANVGLSELLPPAPPLFANKDEVVEYYNEAANKTKQYLGYMVVEMSEGTKASVLEASNSAINAAAVARVPNDYPSGFSGTHFFAEGDGKSRENIPLNRIMPRKGEELCSVLLPQAVQLAYAKKTGDSIKIILTLAPESGSGFDYIPENHSACTDYIPFDGSILPNATYKSAHFNYSGATLTAIINSDGMLDSLTVDEPMVVNCLFHYSLIVRMLYDQTVTVSYNWHQDFKFYYQ